MKTKLFLLLFIPFISFAQTQLGLNLRNPDENPIKPSEFGTGIAISADGSIIAVGAPGNNENSFVRVYKYLNNEWLQLGADIVNESILEKVGSSVSLSADGKILAIGAVNGGDLDEGLVRFYEYKDNSWQKFKNEIIGGGTQHHIGYKVVMTPDAKFVAVSTINNSSTNNGYVKLFENISGVWIQRGKTLEGESNHDALGLDIDLSDDGNTLAVINRGKKIAQVFKFENNDWTQIGNNFIDLNIGNRQGLSISLSGNGNKVAIGATGVSVYENNGGTWTLVGTKIAYGSYSKLSSDGTKITIGDPYYSKVRNYIFKNNSWSQRGSDIETWRNSRLGSKLALSIDGETIFSFPVIYSFKKSLNVSKFNILKEVAFYPNPTKSSFKVNVSKNLQLKEVTLFNLLGKKLFKSNNSNINLLSYPKGVYFAKIITNKGSITKKIIKI
jgi:hypothetical protein